MINESKLNPIIIEAIHKIKAFETDKITFDRDSIVSYDLVEFYGDGGIIISLQTNDGKVVNGSIKLPNVSKTLLILFQLFTYSNGKLYFHKDLYVADGNNVSPDFISKLVPKYIIDMFGEFVLYYDEETNRTFIKHS